MTDFDAERHTAEEFAEMQKVEKEIDGLPRRNRLDCLTPAELAIFQAIQAVETVGAHPLLTEAVILLGQAKDKVADYVER